MAPVLFLERDKELGEAVKQCLEKAGVAVELYHDGKEGLAAFLRQDYSLLLTEVFLPGLDGLSLLKIAAKMKKRVPVVLITTLSQKEAVVEAKKWGVYDFILKPFEEKRLIQVVKNAILKYETEQKK